MAEVNVSGRGRPPTHASDSPAPRGGPGAPSTPRRLATLRLRHGRLPRRSALKLDRVGAIAAPAGGTPPAPTRPVAHFLPDSHAVFAVPRVGKPGYLTPVVDPTFGTVITRIAGDPGTAVMPAN